MTDLPADGKCEDEYQLPGEGTPKGRVCACKKDGCNGASPTAGEVTTAAAVLAALVTTAAAFRAIEI